METETHWAIEPPRVDTEITITLPIQRVENLIYDSASNSTRIKKTVRCDRYVDRPTTTERRGFIVRYCTCSCNSFAVIISEACTCSSSGPASLVTWCVIHVLTEV